MVQCIYCQHESKAEDTGVCSHCGMALPKKDLRDRGRLRKPFVWAFWGIVIFCFVMMLYLPRTLPG